MNFITAQVVAMSWQPSLPVSSTESTTLVVIDSNVHHPSQLAAGVQTGTETLILDAERDGVEQITEALHQCPHVSQLHLVAHGIPGTLFLGNTALSLDTLDRYANQIRQWFCSNNSGQVPSLLLYGCRVAAGDAGTEFLEKLHGLSGAAIAASRQRVGNPGKGGTWHLETRLGSASFNTAFTDELQQTYAETFISFGTPTQFSVGNAPVSIAVGDFNEDERLDLVVSNSDASNASVLINRGNGTFAPAVNLPIGNKPAGIVAADFDNDGDTDFAVALENGDGISVRYGNGDGTFDETEFFSTASSRPIALAAADLNGDNRLDLITTNNDRAEVIVLLSTGDRTFGPANRFTVASAGFKSVAVGDFNRDGFQDLAVTNSAADRISVLINTRNGGFNPQATYEVGNGFFGIAAGDLNRDGNLDLVTTNEGTGRIAVLRGNADGTFGAAQFTELGDTASPGSVAIADFDLDGNRDVAIAARRASNLVILPGNGTGGFGTPILIPSQGNSQFGLAVGNFDNDSSGRSDIAVANLGGANVSVLLNTTQVNPAPTVSITNISDPRTTAVDTITIVFSEAVTDFDLSELTLTRNGTAVSLEAATLTTTDSITFTLGNLTPLTTASGNYVLTLATGNIVNQQLRALANGVSESWRTGRTGTSLPGINFNAGTPGVTLVGDSQANTLVGTTGNDVLRGLRQNDTLRGGRGRDQLNGGRGRDDLFGGLGADFLQGGQGNDRLNGGDGNDILVGGAGEDTLTGGAGRDTFRIDSVFLGNDTLTDFEIGQDLIDLRNIFLQPAFSGTNTFDQFLSYIALESTGANTLVQIDADGSGAETTFVTVATLLNVSSINLTSEQFILS